MIEFNNLPGLEWSRVCAANFWSVGLACVQTEETLSEKLGWIQGDEDKTWFLALERAALNLIRQYPVMAVNLTDANIYLVSLRDILRTVQTFDWDDLVGPLKDWLVICQSVGDLFLADLIVDIDSRPDPTQPVSLPPPLSSNNSKKSTPSPDARACGEFVATVVNNEASYAAEAAAEEKELTANFARETTDLLRHENFAPRKFRLDTLRSPPLLPETADAIGLWYGRLHLRAKTKFHVDQMQVELSRLRILVQQGCRRIKTMESEIKYIQSLEAQREDQVRILKGVHDQQLAHRREIMACQEALKALIEVPDNSEEEKNVCLGVKKPAAQVPSPAASTLVLGAGQPVGSGAPSPAPLSGRVFADTQDANIYKEFKTADDEM